MQKLYIIVNLNCYRCIFFLFLCYIVISNVSTKYFEVEVEVGVTENLERFCKMKDRISVNLSLKKTAEHQGNERF